MRCFTHQDKEAVGVCKVCSKGICSECASDLGHSLACKSSCEEEANLMNSTSKQKRSGLKLVKAFPVFFTIMGFISIYFGIEFYPTYNLTLFTGIAFLMFAGADYFFFRRKTSNPK